MYNSLLINNNHFKVYEIAETIKLDLGLKMDSKLAGAFRLIRESKNAFRED